MKKHASKLFSSVLVLSLILTQSSSLIYSIKASSEYVSDIASEEIESAIISEEQDATLSEQEQSEAIEITQSESTSDEESTSDQGIVSKVVNSFKSDRSLAKATNGAASIEIVDYDETAGMEQNTIYDVKVTADFSGDITSSGKTLEFTLPEGMTFVQIPVVEGLYNTSSVDTSVLAQMGSDDPLTKATTNITLPTKESVTNSTYGAVKYEFTSGTTGVGITFKVKLDYQKVLNSQTVPGGMTAVVEKAGSSIGSVSQVIKATAETREVRISRDVRSLTTETLVSTDTEEYLAQTSYYFFASHNNIAATNSKIYYYYPEGADFVSVVGGLASSSAFTYEVDDVNNCVTFTQVDKYVKLSGLGTTITYKYTQPTTEGLYTSSNGYTIEFETYNGDTHVMEVGTKDDVQVVTQKANEIEIVGAYSYNDDNTVEQTSFSGIMWNIKNPKSYEIENQVIEYTLDDTLSATVVSFPYDLATNNSQPVSQVMYKTHQSDTWITLNQAQLDQIVYLSNSGVIDLSDIGMASGETLSTIKIWTGSYASNYYIQANVATVISFSGVLADIIEPATTGAITYSQYDENDQANTTITNKRSITAAETMSEQKATSRGTLLYYDESGTRITNAIAGDKVTAKGRLTSFIYFTYNLQTFKNPVLYIRETDQYKVDINNIKLTYKGQEIDYTYEKKVDTEGNVVYKVITSPNVELGFAYDTDSNTFVDYALDFEINLITDQLSSGNISNNDLVLYGSNEYDITGLTYNDSYPGVVDTYDMDGDGSTVDTVMGNTPVTLLLKPNTNIVVESAFSKDGTDENVEFINGDDSTAAVLKPGETYEYIATVINNAGESVDEFTAIIPVPKTGDNFGSFFQDEAFTWTMTLASLPTAPDGFEFYYSTDVTASTVLNGATWTKTPKNLDDVKMIKMVATHTIVAGETVEVRVPYTIGETYDSTISGNKAGNVNAFKVAYEQKTSSYNGVLSGTWAGATYILAPEIELEDLNYIVGNSADLEEKVVATDFYGEQIDMTDITYDGSNVPVVDGLYSEVGTYQVEYTATDRNGLTVTGTRLIKIDGLPEVEAEDQVYYITESDIEGQVDDSGVGYANRAGSEVGSALIKEEIGTTYEILSYSETLTEEPSEVGSETSSEVDSEVSSEEDSETTEVETLAFAAASETVVDQTFDKVGYYDVKYTAVDSFGQVAEKTVLVTVLDVEETPSEPTEEPSESKSDKLSDMTIADTGVNLVGTIIATLAILISLIMIKRNLLIKQ